MFPPLLQDSLATFCEQLSQLSESTEIRSSGRSKYKVFQYCHNRLRAAYQGLYIAKESQVCFGADSNLSPSEIRDGVSHYFERLESMALTCVPLLRRVGTVSSCHLHFVLCLAFAEVMMQRYPLPRYRLPKGICNSVIVLPNCVHTTVQEEVMWTFSLDVKLCLHKTLDVFVITSCAV